MSDLKDINIIKIIEGTLNCVDPRLIDHGKRVAYIVYRILRHCPGFHQAQIRAACITALLHDIGAYKTENIDELLIFETKNVWDHAIYGYLFAKYFSPIYQYSPYILLHHACCEDLRHVPERYHALSQYMLAADRIDILSQGKDRDENAVIRHLNFNRNKMFFPDTVDLILDNRLYLFGEAYNRDEAFNSMLYDSTELSAEAAEAYLKMIVFSIDFRSPQTVTHTIATTSISKSLAEILRIPDEDRYPLAIGALLHDLGKSGTPTELLENTGRLNEAEMAVVRKHVVMTKEVLDGNVSDKITRIAARHHEKLDGSGYPEGLPARELTLPERIVAVADILSALHGARSYKEAMPKERVLSILREMGGQGLLDSDVVDAAAAHYDSIIEKTDQTSEKIVEIYNQLDREHTELKNALDHIGEIPCGALLREIQYHTAGIARIEEW